MELSEILEEIMDNWREILITSLIFGLLGVVLFHLIPTKYVASGSIFVTHKVDLVKREEFTYEGFYAQQTSKNYTETVIGLIESIDIRMKALESTGGSVTSQNLRNLKKDTVVKETAPQLITFYFKGNSIEYVTALWNAFVTETITASNSLNETQGNPQIHVTTLDNTPIVYASYTNVFLNLGIGVFAGFILSTFIIALKEYLS